MDEKFLCDRNLGKLSKWLRILGYDTLYHSGNANRDFLRRADQEGRIALTRKRDLRRQWPEGRLIVIEADRVDAQLTEMMDTLSLTPDPSYRMSRCLRCNAILEEVAKEAVEGLVPLYVHQSCTRFQRCARCGRIFWPGTHPRHIEEALRRRIPSRRP
jgi:uncharacterized protein with PIN domain